MLFTSNSAVLGLAILAAAAALAAAQHGHYFVLGTGMPVTISRIEPLMSPGVVPSQHVHSVVGGNAFAATMDFNTTQKANCSTVQPKADKSNYWMPNLYFQYSKNHSFIRVPEQPYHKIYYFYGTHTANPTFDISISEFPQEFRMMAGSALLRSGNATANSPNGPGLEWFCHTSSGGSSSIGFPSGFTSCPNGLAASIYMPTCWNGEDFNVSDPGAHMAYATADGMEGCPEGFRVKRFPQIFIEYWLNTMTFDGLYTADDKPWVLSMGDQTGFGFHFDFINGWAPGVLDAAMKTCIPGNTDNPPLDDPSCFGPHGGIYTPDEIAQCMLPNPVNEDVGWTYPEVDNPQGGKLTTGGVLEQLPGCQTLSEGPDPATLKTC